MSAAKKELIKSASIILVGSTRCQTSTPDYKLLFLKRNKQMRVAPGFSVFPGGKLDETVDSTLKWLDIFKVNDLKHHFASLITSNSIGRRYETMKNSLPLEIAYRLCALRETFEETGLLLAKERNNQTQTSMLSGLVSNSVISDWHERVVNDSAKFIDMFVELAPLVPDVFALHEWSNWVTPLQEKTRFDTYFFTCFLPQLPSETQIRLNKQENESLEVYRRKLLVRGGYTNSNINDLNQIVSNDYIFFGVKIYDT